MKSEQREELENIILHMRAGRIKRRSFLERALALGLTLSSATTVLAGCSTTSVKPGCTPKNRVSRPNILVWESEHDDLGIFDALAARFQAKNPGIQIVYHNNSYADNQQYNNITAILSTCNDAVDIASIDIIWLAEFAKNGWILPLDTDVKNAINDKYGAKSQTVASCTYNGQIYSAPLRIDQGVLYYRADISPLPPKSWHELVSVAEEAIANRQGGIIEGYVWQTNQYEGLVCNFIEVLAGYGGSIISADNRKVTIYSPAAVDALTEMMSWIGTISPLNIIGVKDAHGKTIVDGYEESDARVRWQNGYAAFMRNWYNAFPIVTDPTQSVVSNVARFSCLPAKIARPQQSVTGYSCLGGWQLAVNQASQNVESAWQFIAEVLTDPNAGSLVPTDQTDQLRSDITIAEITKNVVARPTLPNYSNNGGISAQIQKALYYALTQASIGNKQRDTAAQILQELSAKIQTMLTS